MMRHVKHLMLLLLLIITSSIALACTNDDTTLNNYRQTEKQEIQAYVTTKLQDNYSEENRSKINEIIAESNKYIDNAKSSQEINDLTTNTKQKLDKIAPQQSAKLEDGVYFLTDTSYEWYKKKLYSHGEIIYDRWLWALIIDNVITVYDKDYTVYTIYDNHGIYRGASFDSTIDIWLSNGNLFLRDWKDKNNTLQYQIDSTYDITSIAETKQLAAPHDITIYDNDINNIALLWLYSQDYGDFGCGVEIKNSECTDFTPIKVGHLSMNTMIVDSLQDYLKQGENLIRIHNIGGYSITNDKKVSASVRSDYVTFRVVVTDGTATAEQIENGKLIRIEEAYNNNLLTTKDLQDIAYYMGCAGDTDYSPTPKNPEKLDSETELKIKFLYLTELQNEFPKATIDDVGIDFYYGTYGSCIAVRLFNEIVMYDLYFEDEYVIGDVTFYDYCGAFIYIALI